MSKQQMIEAIRQNNRSAPEDFLIHFDEEQLRRYLDRLSHLSNHRGRQSVWRRESSCRSVVTRTAA